MIKKTITYVDYDENERTEDYLFNLKKSEIIEMQLSETGGLDKLIEKIAASQDTKKVVELFKEIILKAYGEKSADGKRFIKSQELRDAFEQTEAYSELFTSLITDPDAAAEFIKGIIPNEPADHSPAKATSKK